MSEQNYQQLALDLLTYKDTLTNIEDSIALKRGEQTALKEDRQRKQDSIQDALELIELKKKVNVLLMEVGNAARDTAKQFLESIVTSALQYIAGHMYSFEIEFSIKNNRPSAEMYVVENNNGIISKQIPQDACGGGFVDIIATVLKLGYTEIIQAPPVKGPLLMDEPGKMVSSAASVRYAEFIKDFAKYYKRQVVMVTHNSTLSGISDNTICIVKHNGESHVIDPSAGMMLEEGENNDQNQNPNNSN